MQYHYPQASLPGLPVELRLIILQHALLLNSRIEIRHQQKCTSNPISTIIKRTLQATISPSSSSRTAWSLLQINSQIRSEALPLFFEFCDFHFYDTLTRSLLASFLQTIGGDAVIGRMKHVSFHTRGKCIMFGLGDAEEEEGYVLFFFLSSYHYLSLFLLFLVDPPIFRVSNSKNNNITFLSLFPAPPHPPPPPLPKPKQKENSTNLPSPLLLLPQQPIIINPLLQRLDNQLLSLPLRRLLSPRPHHQPFPPHLLFLLLLFLPSTTRHLQQHLHHLPPLDEPQPVSETIVLQWGFCVSRTDV